MRFSEEIQAFRKVTVRSTFAKIVLRFVSTFWISSTCLADDHNISTKSYEISDHGILELMVPNKWKDSVRQPSKQLPPTITFSPASGNRFKVMITTLWHAKSDPSFNQPEKIRSIVERQGLDLLETAVEKAIQLEEINGQDAAGYFYSLTDKSPKPDEYKYMSQGAVGVGKLLLTFTILLKKKDAPERQLALEILRNAKHRIR